MKIKMNRDKLVLSVVAIFYGITVISLSILLLILVTLLVKLVTP